MKESFGMLLFNQSKILRKLIPCKLKTESVVSVVRGVSCGIFYLCAPSIFNRIDERLSTIAYFPTHVLQEINRAI